MMKCFENSFTPKPTAVLLNQVYNTNDWLAPCLDKITGHSGPHAFKIILNANGKAFVLWKNWTTDKVIIVEAVEFYFSLITYVKV